MDPTLWQKKAVALLWPTPLAAVDPDGEAKRREILTARFPWLALDQHADIADRAATLADGIQRAGGTPERGSGPVGLLHPLSHRPLGPRAQIADLSNAWAARLSAVVEPVDADSWRRLWRGWVAPDAPDDLDRVPGDRERRDYPALARASLASALVASLTEGDMPALLLVHVGPVQSFIETARRTHDLWSGSYTIAWLGFHVAKTLAEHEGPEAVVYPFLGRHPLARKLLWGDAFSGADRRRLLQPANANRILAIVPSGNLEQRVGACRRAVEARWGDLAREVHHHLHQVLPDPKWSGWDERWEAQIDDLVDFSAVAMPWSMDVSKLEATLAPTRIRGPRESNPAAYFAPLFDLTHRLLSGARAAELPTPWPGDRRPKCVVDGIREQMGPVSAGPRWRREFWRALAGALRAGSNGSPPASLALADGEGLSAVSLAKRLSPQHWFGTAGAELGLDWGKAETDRPLLRFPSTRSFAAATFRVLATVHAPAAADAWGRAIEPVYDVLEFTPPGNLLAAMGSISRADPLLAADGLWLFEEAYDIDRTVKDHAFDESARIDRTQLRRRLAAAEQALGRLAGELGRNLEMGHASRPTPYFAVLMLDGDDMGRWLTGQHEKLGGRPLYPALHAALSERIGHLATEHIPAIVDRHLGRVVYCGGDDLLAMLPLHTALPCANAVRRCIRSEERGLGGMVTVSAGLAIAHSLDPLQTVLGEARRAEKQAKKEKQKDSLAIHVLLRSGPELELCLQWELDSSEGGAKFIAADEIGVLVDAQVGDGTPLGSQLPAIEEEERLLRRLSERDSGPFYHRLTQRVGARPFLKAVLERYGSKRVVETLRLARFLRRELPADSLAQVLEALPSRAAGGTP